MLRSIEVLFLNSVFLTAALVFAQGPTTNKNMAYDVLGLKLGMTAQEAETVIQKRLKIMPGTPPYGYRVDSTPRRYQTDGTFVDEFVISNSKMELVGNFTEVYPGQGTGKEALYQISYTPRPVFEDDKKDFVERVVAKFGPPTLIRNQVIYFWIDHPYRSEREAVQAGVPVLELETSSLKLTLSNESIRQRMVDAFNQTQKIPL